MRSAQDAQTRLTVHLSAETNPETSQRRKAMDLRKYMKKQQLAPPFTRVLNSG